MTTQELKNKVEKVLGNNIRCLLPSYWWKNLFHSVADRIDEVEQKIDEVEQKIDDIEIPDGMPIVNSIAELDSLNLDKGRIVSVVDGMRFSQCYQPTDEELSSLAYSGELYSKLTRVKSIDIKDNPLEEGEAGVAILVDFKETELSWLAIVCLKQGGLTQKIVYGNISGQDITSLLTPRYIEIVNKILSENDMRFMAAKMDGILEVEPEASLAALDKMFSINIDVDAYIKGSSWERLAKEGDVVGGGAEALSIYFPIGEGTQLSVEQKNSNANTYSALQSSNKKPIHFYVVVGDIGTAWIPVCQYYQSKPQGGEAYSNIITFDWDDSSPFYKMHFKLYSDGRIEFVGYIKADAELSTTSENPVQNKVVTKRFELLAPIMFLPLAETEEAKAMNAEAYRQYLETTGYNRRVAIYSILGGGTLNVVSSMGPLSNAPEHQYITLIWYDLGGGIREMRVYSDGSITEVEIESDAVEVDTELSEESSNAIANKTVTAALKNKVDKVDGKQLSTEDFTSILKAKLEGLNNYDDTSIRNAINSLTTQINTLVSGDASVAIESFNEIIAFLNGIEDSESLDSIIAAIEQQIAGKQDTISDLADIRRGAALGATALQSVPEGYVTSALLRQEITNVENQITGVATVIPKKISQLNNDSQFTTEEYVNTQVRTAIISALNTEV